MKSFSQILFLLLACLTLEVFAQVYPSKPIRLIIPFPPGGSSDILGRELGFHLGRALGAPLVIENRSGANGLIGTEVLAKAAPDGYTLMFHILTSHITNPWVHRKLPYDIVRDFASVTLVGSSGLVFVAHRSFPATGINDLVRLAKANPSAISVGSFGIASMGHLSIELLKTMANVDVTHVSYRGSAPAVLDTLKGQIPVSVVPLPAALPYIRQGRLRPLAMTIAKGSKQLPNVPAVAETSDLEGYDLALMFGVLAPAHTPATIVKQVQESVRIVLSLPNVRRRLYERGMDQIFSSTPEEMDEYIRIEMEKIGNVAKSAGVIP